MLPSVMLFGCLFPIAFELLGAPTAHGHDNILYARLPFVEGFDPDQVICVKVGFDGTDPVPTVFDSGADSIIVTTSFSKTLGLKPHDPINFTTATANPANAHTVSLTSITLGSETITDVLAASFDMPSYFPCPAIIGSTLFRSLAVRVDFQNHLLDFFLGAGYKYDGTGIAIPASFENTHAIISAKVDGVTGRFMIDTGMDDSISLNASFVAKNHLRKPDGHYLRDCYEGAGGFGFVDTARLSSFEIGSYKFSQPIVNLGIDPKADRPDADGIIGIEVLRRFNVIFDPTEKQLVLEKLPAFDDPFVADRAGFTCTVVDNRFSVVYVEPSSPAEEAGIKVGDIVLERYSKPYQPSDMYRKDKHERDPAGTKVPVVIDRAGKRINVVITLRNLI